MTRILGRCLLIGIVLVTFSAVQAQERHEIAVGRAGLQSDRQAIVAANLPMTDAQAKVFWPMFRDYRGQVARIGDRIEELILAYAKNYDTLTDEQAKSMLDEFLAIQKDDIKIKAEWAPKFGKVLPPKSVTRFYQIENKLDAILRFQAAGQIPLVDVPNP